MFALSTAFRAVHYKGTMMTGTTRVAGTQLERVWRAFVEARQRAQAETQREQVLPGASHFRAQVQRHGQALGDSGSPGTQTTSNAVTGNGAAGADSDAALKKLFAEAEKWLGFKEKGKDGNPFSKYFGRPAEAWCADFVSYLHEVAGMPVGKKGVGFPGCTEMAQWFKSKDAFHNGKPSPGDAIFFDFGSRRDGDNETHVGIVVKVENGKVYTIEGNIGNRGGGAGGGVSRRTYDLNDPTITGYGSRLRLGKLGEGTAPVDLGNADMSGPATNSGTSGGPSPSGASSGSSGGASGSRNPGSHTVPRRPGDDTVPPSVQELPPGGLGDDLFSQIMGALSELTEHERKVLNKTLGKSSAFAQYGQQRMGPAFDPQNPPEWLGLEFLEGTLGELSQTSEGEATLAPVATLEGESLIAALEALLDAAPAQAPLS